MKVLALDLSTRRGSVALFEGADPIAVREWDNDQRKSAPFFDALSDLISNHGSAETLVVGLGPGSYAGTRIAISVAIGLQLTTGAKLYGLPSITAVSDENDYVVIGDAKRSSFFFSRVRNHLLEVNPVLLGELEMVTRISELTMPVYTSDDLPQFDGVKLRFPSAALLAAHARNLPDNLTRAPLTPIYLREPHITVSRGTA